MKEINNLWIWPPGGSGNFILKHYYGGKTLPNNEFVANTIKWFPKYLNVSHAEYFLQAKSEYVLGKNLHERAKKEILAQEEVDYAWHWIPVHIKDFLLQELDNFPSDEIFVTDYRDLFFEYKQDTLDFYKLDKNDVQDYTTKNIELIETFIKEKLNPDMHEVFLNKLVDLQA